MLHDGRVMSEAPCKIFSHHARKWVKGDIVESTAETVTVQYETEVGLFLLPFVVYATTLLFHVALISHADFLRAILCSCFLPF